MAAPDSASRFDQVLVCAAEAGLLPVPALASCRRARDASLVIFEARYKQDFELLLPRMLQLEARHAAMLRLVWPS